MKVGTWNLENLFTPEDPDGPPDQETYDAKLAALASVVEAISPDVLAVQEVGNPSALADLVARLDGSWQLALADPDARGIRVGVIARRPIEEAEQVRDLPRRIGPVRVDDSGTTLSTMGRAALRARVLDDAGEPVDVVSVHLKSKLLSYPGGRFSPRDEDERARYAVYALHRRAAEAAAVRTFVTAQLDDGGRTRALVVAGDLNDEALAATTQILLGPPGSEIGTRGFDTPDRGDGSRLWNLESLIPEADRFSRVYRGRRELIDHLLVSRDLVTRVSAVATAGPVPASIADDPRARLDARGSDHRPVIATFSG